MRNCIARMCLSLFLIGGVFGLADPAWGGTITAADCSAFAVRAALSSASRGDTVIVPAGNCNWTTPVSWRAPADVILKGAGNGTIGGDRTVIVDDYASNGPLLSITTNASGSFRMTGVTFQGGTGLVKWNGMILIAGQSRSVRLDHLHVNMQTYTPNNNGAMISFHGWVYGVVDHSQFDLQGVGNGIQVSHGTYNGSQEGDGAFADVTGLGTSKFIFVENNIFNSPTHYGIANDCSRGGRFVWRYNTMNTASLQTHPTGGKHRGRGCRAWEIYLNRFNGSNEMANFNVYFLSSGTGVLWGNMAPTGYNHFVTIHSMRTNNATYPQAATPNGWGYCGTAFNGTGSNWDQNSDASTGYACLDQPGRGVGDLLSGAFPNVTNVTTGCKSSSPCAWPRQALEPVYEWLNTWATANRGAFWTVYEPIVLGQDRDYYLHVTPFTGAAGTGAGLLSARPEKCAPGVAYWATDSNTLYQCSASNTWIAYYRPYIYPHPLITDTARTKKD